MKCAALILALAVISASFPAAAGEAWPEGSRRSDYPFFNPPRSAPLRSGLSALRVSGSSDLSADEWRLLSSELSKKNAAVVALRCGEDGSEGTDALCLDADGPGRPTSEAVDRFVEFVRSQPDDGWIHIRGGSNDKATTAFMAMADMMRNAKEVPFADVLMRQRANFGSDLLHTGPATAEGWRDSSRLKEFLRRFHEYARKDVDGFETPWSVWTGVKASSCGRR